MASTNHKVYYCRMLNEKMTAFININDISPQNVALKDHQDPGRRRPTATVSASLNRSLSCLDLDLQREDLILQEKRVNEALHRSMMLSVSRIDTSSFLDELQLEKKRKTTSGRRKLHRNFTLPASEPKAVNHVDELIRVLKEQFVGTNITRVVSSPSKDVTSNGPESFTKDKAQRTNSKHLSRGESRRRVEKKDNSPKHQECCSNSGLKKTKPRRHKSDQDGSKEGRKGVRSGAKRDSSRSRQFSKKSSQRSLRRSNSENYILAGDEKHRRIKKRSKGSKKTSSLNKSMSALPSFHKKSSHGDTQGFACCSGLQTLTKEESSATGTNNKRLSSRQSRNVTRRASSRIDQDMEKKKRPNHSQIRSLLRDNSNRSMDVDFTNVRNRSQRTLVVDATVLTGMETGSSCRNSRLPDDKIGKGSRCHLSSSSNRTEEETQSADRNKPVSAARPSLLRSESLLSNRQMKMQDSSCMRASLRQGHIRSIESRRRRARSLSRNRRCPSRRDLTKSASVSANIADDRACHERSAQQCPPTRSLFRHRA